MTFYFRVYSQSFAYGRVLNGEVQFSGNGNGGDPPISSGTWNTLRIVVKVNKQVELSCNGIAIGKFNARFSTRGYGGVFVVTGYKNSVQFRNYKVSPYFKISTLQQALPFFD